MEIIKIQTAKIMLKELIKKALAGENVIISENGQQLVKLTPLIAKEKIKNKQRQPGGSWKGQISIAEDFDNEDEGINQMFEGKYS